MPKNIELLIHKTTLRRAGSSYIKSYEWIINKRVVINPKNDDGSNCFQYAITVALNHQNIRNHSEEILKIQPLFSKYNSNNIDFP